MRRNVGDTSRPKTESHIGKKLWCKLDKKLFLEGSGKSVVAERSADWQERQRSPLTGEANRSRLVWP